MMLRETLREIAEQAPSPAVPPGLFDRARRRHRRRQQWAAVAVVVLILLIGYGLSPAAPDAAQPAAGPSGLPSRVVAPPSWTEDLTRSPNGPASVVFWGPAVPNRSFHTDVSTPIAVVGLTQDRYRTVYPSQASLVLSPDGRTLLLPYLHANSPDLASTHWRTNALDLVTGKSRTLAAGVEPVSWSSDGRHVLLVQPDRWDHPDAPAATINDITVRVVAWPSARVEWSIHISRPDSVEGESNFLLALSPDATRLAVSTSRQLRVYRGDGAIVWHRDVGWSALAGPVAWRDRTHLAVLRRDLSGAQASWYDPSHWTLEYVDPATGDPVTGPRYPVLSSAFSVQIIAWRGDTAYAVARSHPADRPDEDQATLVRLDPGATGAPQVLTMPTGAANLNVAADYVDVTRPAGPADFGVSTVEVFALALRPAGIAAIVLLLAWLWWRRRKPRIRSIPPAP